MITLTLLHPVQSTPVQSWSFEQDPVIRIGRAVDNHVVLYSAVVSRYHVEIRQTGTQWEVVNIGTNGTYLDGKRVHQAPLSDGNIMRLARSGPNIQIHIDESGNVDNNYKSDITAAPNSPGVTAQRSAEQRLQEVAAPSPEANPHLRSSDQEFRVVGQTPFPKPPQEEQHRSHTPPIAEGLPASITCTCQRSSASQGSLVCTDCGLPLKVWRQIGEYHVLKPLGTGDNTFIAWRDGHMVVLKTLQQEWLEHEDALVAFQEQASQLCQMSHPGMPKIYEAFEVDSYPYLVSEMIYGQNLKQWVADRGPLPQTQTIEWISDICEVLDYLHQQTPAIIHRNLKPANLVRPTIPHGFKEVVLVNFGEMQLLSPDAGTFIGSVGYTAPELQAGKAAPASDLYALGATLVYILTGQEPDAFYRLGDEEFRLHVEDVPRLSPEMADLIQQLTHPQPQKRYASAAHVADAMKALLP
ncbi:FHA domain-containing protein [Acaryochloris sp. IP29b_bin.148]|uniref:protein kinase domain-containing protein n=1 Tax=Acaryochloris sp. IP29b_bin.148 TaxID=2969218 RepID=UPI0026238235|nr:FHA domain-containing protein [Acaryochloris sp. IP29b_bin.148]